MVEEWIMPVNTHGRSLFVACAGFVCCQACVQLTWGHPTAAEGGA